MLRRISGCENDFHSELPDDSAVSVPPGSARAFWNAAGWPVCGQLAVRADVLEKVSAELRKVSRKGPFPLPDPLPAWLSASREAAATVVDGLGYRHVQIAGESRFVPPYRSPSRRHHG